MNYTRRLSGLVILPACLLVAATLTAQAAPEGPPAAPGDSPAIARAIDASNYFRRFPDLVAHRNTSIQKAPAPALAERSEQELGRPKVTRCWLNLDEMWDYRTRQYDHNYVIGVPKYAGVKEKFRESWGWVKETRVPFDSYLKAFGQHSDAVMLCIRRYERDILDGKLGVTMADWKMIFKSAVKHARQVSPSVRYIEVCNEYGCKGFIGCTHEEYYRFYRLAYQAVNEVNAELNLTGEDRLLVGGPNAVRSAMTSLDRFFENFSKDPASDKKLDFVTWHEYHNRYASIAQREKEVNGMLAAHGLATGLPMFITEHDPYHNKAGQTQFNLINAACLVKSLYFTSLHSPGVGIFPWVQYHDRKIQTRFMWFDGPNEPDTQPGELHMLPSGCSMKLLSMHKDWEIAVDNDVANDHIVLASVQHDGLVVEAINYGEPRDVRLQIDKLSQVFSALGDGKVRIVKYLIDEEHSNCVADPDYPGGLEQVGDCRMQPQGGSLTLTHPQLAKHGIVLWKVVPEKKGVELEAPAVQEK